MSKLTLWENEYYPSILAAAQAAGVDWRTMKRWQANGLRSLADVKAAPHAHKGYAEEARRKGISRQAVQQAAQKDEQ